ERALEAVVRAAARRRRLHARILRRGARRQGARGGARRLARAADSAAGARRAGGGGPDALVQALVRLGGGRRGGGRRRHRGRRGGDGGEGAEGDAAAGNRHARPALLNFRSTLSTMLEGDSVDDGNRAPRVEATFRVSYPNVDQLLVAYSSDLSKGGMFLTTDQFLPVNAVVRVNLELGEGSAEIPVICRV